METEKDNSIPFLDTSVIRDSNGLLTTSVYRKPTHTDQYLAYDSHHPQSVKRGIESLSKDVFERRTSTGSEVFSLTICLDAKNFVLISFFSLIRKIYLKVSTKPPPNDAKRPLPVDVRRSETLLLKLPIVKCLYDRAKHLITKRSVISEEKKHLSSVLVSNGYPSSFIRKLVKTTRPTANNEPTQEFKSTAVLPYIKGVSEVLRRCLQQQGVRTVFKSDTTLRSYLVRPKDALEPGKQEGVVS